MNKPMAEADKAARMDMVIQTMDLLQWNLESLIYWAYFYAERRISVTRLLKFVLDCEHHQVVTDIVADFCLDELAHRVEPLPLKDRKLLTAVAEEETPPAEGWEGSGFFKDYDEDWDGLDQEDA